MTTNPLRNGYDPWSVLRDVGAARDGDIEVAEAALALGLLDRSGVSVDRYHHHLRQLAGGFRPGGARTAGARADALAAYMRGEQGYSGDTETYDNLENANLPAVIDRRKGLPVALVILYLHVARARGWAATAINFPGHVLMRLEGECDRVMTDPFAGGSVVTAQGMRRILKATSGTQAELKPALYEPLDNRGLLTRLLGNTKIRVLQVGDMTRAVEVLRRMVTIAPMNVDAWYELGVLLVHQEHLRAGRDALETCLACLDQLPERHDLRMQVRETLIALAASFD